MRPPKGPHRKDQAVPVRLEPVAGHLEAEQVGVEQQRSTSVGNGGHIPSAPMRKPEIGRLGRKGLVQAPACKMPRGRRRSCPAAEHLIRFPSMGSMAYWCLSGLRPGATPANPGVQKGLIFRGFLEAALKWRRGRGSPLFSRTLEKRKQDQRFPDNLGRLCVPTIRPA